MELPQAIVVDTVGVASTNRDNFVVGMLAEPGDPYDGHTLGRNYLLGNLGDAINALLCGAGHNIRLILNKLREKLSLFFAHLLFGSYCCFGYRQDRLAFPDPVN